MDILFMPEIFWPVISIVVLIIILLLRPVYLWYFRLNEIADTLNEINRKLPELKRSTDFNKLLDQIEQKSP